MNPEAKRLNHPGAGAILHFWERRIEDASPHPSEAIESWFDLIQLAATDLLRREEEILPHLAKANGFSSREARRALRGALGGLTRDALLGLWEDQDFSGRDVQVSGEDQEGCWPERTVIFAGGAIPQPAIQSLVAALMVSQRVLIRPSRQDPYLVPTFVDALVRVQSTHPQLASGVSALPDIRKSLLCATWDHEEAELTRRIVGSADALVIYGDTKTIDELLVHRSPDADTFIYGPRLSLAVLDAASTLDDSLIELAMNDFAEDMVSFDQRGCLSPQVLYVINPRVGDIDRVAAALAVSLSRLEMTGGFTPSLPSSAAGAIHSLRALYSMDPERKRRLMASDSVPGWTLMIDEMEAEVRPLPGYQTLRIVPLSSWERLAPLLAPWTGQLQCMGIGPDTSCIPENVADELGELGLSRICALGRMQAPPLEWTHDGNPFFPVQLPENRTDSHNR